MANDIENIQLKFSCDANWEAMIPDGGGRFCAKCQKKVYDFTNCKVAEFQQILAENNYKVWGRFNLQQMATEPILLPKWKKWLSAALVLIGITLTHCKSNKTQTLTGDTVSLPPVDSVAISMQNHLKDAKPANKL